MHAESNIRAVPSRWFAAHDGRADDGLDQTFSSDGFRALKLACRASGGIARADDLARLLCDRSDGGQGDPILGDLLARAEVFGFVWRGNVWLPMFQFDLRRLSVQRAPQRVRAELQGACALDGWDCASWFARPHAGLDDRAPVDLMATDLPGVLEVARADRWLLNG